LAGDRFGFFHHCFHVYFLSYNENAPKNVSTIGAKD